MCLTQARGSGISAALWWAKRGERKGRANEWTGRSTMAGPQSATILSRLCRERETYSTKNMPPAPHQSGVRDIRYKAVAHDTHQKETAHKRAGVSSPSPAREREQQTKHLPASQKKQHPSHRSASRTSLRGVGCSPPSTSLRCAGTPPSSPPQSPVHSQAKATSHARSARAS